MLIRIFLYPVRVRHFSSFSYDRIVVEVFKKEKGRKGQMKTDTVVFEEKNKTLTATIQCEIDHHAAKDLREKIDREIFLTRPNTIVLDFASVDFMDSSGIALILGRAECAEGVGASVIVTGLADPIYKLIGLSGIDKIKNLTICRTLRSEK